MANEFKIKNGLVVSGSAEIENNLTVRGTITADEYHISVVSSSVLYESGSTRFGDSLDDSHEFTGSLNVTGSILLNGTTVGTGKLDETTFNSFTASYVSDSGSFESRVGDLESFSSSLDNSFLSETEFQTYSGSINTFTSSIDGRVDNLETESGSIRSNFNTFTSSYTNVSTSLDSRLDSLETLSGSFTGSFSGSFKGDGTNLFNIPASGVTGLNLTQIADGSVTASVSNTNGLRVNSKTEITGSLIVTNGITGSIDFTNITNKPTLVSGSSQIDITGTTGYSTFSSSIDTSIGGLSSSVATTTSNLSSSIGSVSSSISSSIGSLSSSVATTTDNIEDRVGNLEVSTGSLNSFTSSISTTIKTKLNTEGVISGSVQVTISDTTGYSTFSSSISSSISDIIVDNLGQDDRLDSLETSSGSLNSFTSSINTTIKTKLNTENVVSGSSQIILSGTTGFSVVSASLSSLSSSISITNFNQDGRLNSIETSTGSLNSFTSSINTTIKDKLNAEGVISGSSQISLGMVNGYSTFSSSIANTDFLQDGRLTSIENKTGSYATTGSNVFVGAQTISGSVIIRENLTVLGSSSITYTTSSQLRVEDNVITVNTSNPAERFGGLQVYDSGSVGEATGSLLWDSQKNRWVYQQSSESTYGGGVLMSGPRSSGSLGDELTLTSGKIARSAGGDHLNDSIITEYSGVAIGVSGSLIVTGSILSTVTPLVSGSEQISFNGITNKPTLVSGSSQVSFNSISDVPSGIVSGSSQVLSESGVWSGSAQLPAGTVSGSSQILFGSISGVPSGLVSGSSQVLSGTGIWSGSAQLPAGTVSGSSQVLNGTTIHSGSFFNGITVVSGSSQITFGGLTGVPSGIVSGSSQVSFGGITGVPSGLVSGSSQVLLSSGIWSGSAQLPAGTVSGSSQVLGGTGIWSGSAQLPAGTVSGSSQISYSGLTGTPSGIVSGSSQITYGSLTGVPSGIVSGSSQVIALLPIGTVSGSSQVLAGTTIHSGSFFNGISVVSGSSQISYGGITGVPSGLVSGSSQISYGSITGVPSGLVSGSSQITLSSTTGFGSYLNQAVLTTSTPTFSTVTATTFTGALTGNASTSTSTSNIGGATWAPSTNILLGQSANNQEWSFDITRNGFTGGYWHVWDSANSTMLKVDAVSGKVSAPYNFVGTLEGNITGTASNITAYTINQSVGTSNSPTFAGLTVNGTVIASQSGFQSATYSAGRNRIWSFGNADAYGLSYFQGSGGYGGSTDMIGFHFGTASVAASKFTFVSDGRFITSGDILPSSNNSYNLGSASLGWANVYTNDLHLSNMNKPEGNDIDGTSGTWTIQEGAENLYIINNRNGKKFKISLEEIL
jgi:hypothetical protein